MRYWDHDYGWGWFGLLVMIVTMVLFWGGLVTIVIILVRRFGYPAHADRPGHGSNAERILDERFARGEIDEKELAARRTELRGEDAR